MDSPMPTPIIDPYFPPGTPESIRLAYALNANCSCAHDDASCSNCLTALPAYLMDSRDAPAIGAIVAIPIIAAAVVLLRTYSRLAIVRQVGQDDFLALAGLALYIPFQVLSIILIQLGSGRHLQYIQFVVAQDHQTLNKTETLDFVAHILYTTALFVCRLSGIAFYLRLLDRSKSWTVALCRISAVLLTLGFIPQIVLLIIHCSPVTGLWPYGWQREAGEHTCLAWGVVYSTNSGISLICDFLLFGIAVTLISVWRINTRDKLLLSPILLPGGLVIGISIARLYLIVQGQWQVDQSWWYDPTLVVENAEIGGTLIALCAPGLKPFVKKCFDANRTYYWKSTKASGSGSYGRWRKDKTFKNIEDSHHDGNNNDTENLRAGSNAGEPVMLKPMPSYASSDRTSNIGRLGEQIVVTVV